MSGDRESRLQAGMDGYVTKPVKYAEMFAASRRLVRLTHAETPHPLCAVAKTSST